MATETRHSERVVIDRGVMGDGNGNVLGCQAEDFDTGCRALVTISRPLHFKLVGGGGVCGMGSLNMQCRMSTTGLIMTMTCIACAEVATYTWDR